jgi:hypothetical protein
MITVKKIFTWAFVAFVIFFIAFRPDGAAQICRALGGALMGVFQGFGDFLSGVTSRGY